MYTCSHVWRHTRFERHHICMCVKVVLATTSKNFNISFFVYFSGSGTLFKNGDPIHRSVDIITLLLPPHMYKHKKIHCSIDKYIYVCVCTCRYNSLDGIDVDCLLALINKSFEKTLKKCYIDSLKGRLHSIYLSEGWVQLFKWKNTQTEGKKHHFINSRSFSLLLQFSKMIFTVRKKITDKRKLLFTISTDLEQASLQHKC